MSERSEKVYIMKKKLEMLPGPEKLKYFLESTNIHYTATEIYEFFKFYDIKSSKNTPFIKSSIRTYLKDLAKTGQIQIEDIPSKRENYYLAEKSKETEYLTIKLVGLWLQHYDDEKLLDCVKEKLSDPVRHYSIIKHLDELEAPDDSEALEQFLGSEDKLKHVSFFQGVGMMDYFKIPYIVGINPFRKESGEHGIGVQRPRQKDWIKELEFGLKARFSALLTTSIIYLPFDKISRIGEPQRRDDGLIECTIEVPFNKHVFDNEKPGIILDGQQRMWALDFIKLKRTFIEGKEPTEFFGPVSIIIGNFETEPEYETSIIRMYFVTSNKTKNLPSKLTTQLSSEIHKELLHGMPTKDQYRATIESMVNILDIEPISPFYSLIDHQKNRFDKIGDLVENEKGEEVRLFARIGVYDMLNDLMRQKPFNITQKKPEQILLLLKNYESWIKVIIDFFNAIKCVYFTDWEDPNSLIKRNVGFYSWGLIFPVIYTYEFKPLSRDKKVRKFISLLSKWKDFDSKLDFHGSSDLNAEYSEEKKEIARTLTSVLEESWGDSTADSGFSEEAQLIMEKAEAKWEEIKMDAGIFEDNF